MEQPKSQLPSTPPLLNLSPDLRSFRAFFKSPTNVLDEEQEKPVEFGELDFESAYALLTQSPTFMTQSPQPATHVPIAGSSATLNAPLPYSTNSSVPQRAHPSPLPFQFPGEPPEQFKDFFLRTRTPSPRLGSPQPLFDLETLQQFPKSELLSVNETTALEQFLDSIIDDPQHKKQQSHTPHPDAGLLSGTPPTTTAGSSYAGSSHELTHGLEIHPLGHYQSQDDAPRSSSIHELSSIPQLRSSPEVGAPSDEDSSQQKKSRKRRKLLSEEEKKLHHTNSEQRRRGQIKQSFENMVQLLPMNQTKKNQPKSTILETAARQIELLISANSELRRLADETI